MAKIRLTSAAAALLTTGGAVAMLYALAAGPGQWWQGYVSEAGTAGRPHATVYRLGLLVLAAGVALLGRALRRAGTLLLLAALFAGTSGVVTCSDRCPLPPFEPTTAADVVHATAGILGMVVLVAVMTRTWLAAVRPALRRLSAVVLALIVPLGAALGVAMLFAGRGAASALLERAVLVVGVSWTVGTALLLSFTGDRTVGIGRAAARRSADAPDP